MRGALNIESGSVMRSAKMTGYPPNIVHATYDLSNRLLTGRTGALQKKTQPVFLLALERAAKRASKLEYRLRICGVQYCNTGTEVGCGKGPGTKTPVI